MKGSFIEGSTIYIRGLERDDLSTIKFWSDDYEVTRYLFRGLMPSNQEVIEKEYESNLFIDTEIEMVIVDKESNKLIGVAGLHSVNWPGRSAEFRVLIGEKDFWQKGLGSEVAQLVTAYGFEKLNLQKVWLGVTKGNEGAYYSYLKSGFVEEGILRREVYRNSKYYDVIRMSILREEYDSKHKEWKTASLIRAQF